MASILDKYGIKEVADVMFYQIGDNGEAGKPVLYLDTLKVSTIEQTAEETEARGGKGNPPLIVWDYGKEINVTLEDALFSAKSMAIMFSGEYNEDSATKSNFLRKTFTYIAPSNGYVPTEWVGPNNKTYAISKTQVSGATTDHDYANEIVVYSDNGKKIEKADYNTEIKKGNTYFVSFYLKIKDVTEIEISPNTFPGNYYITGDTYARKQATGRDEFFQFIIPNAKVQSEQTLTLEAEGDPTVFNMNLRVLRSANGEMMKLVKYDVVGVDSSTSVGDGDQLIGNDTNIKTVSASNLGEPIPTPVG